MLRAGMRLVARWSIALRSSALSAAASGRSEMTTGVANRASSMFMAASSTPLYIGRADGVERPARPRPKSSASVLPSRSRSMPAQAIMAPLSVQSFTGGATRRAPCSAASVLQAAAQIEVGRDAARHDQRRRRRRSRSALAQRSARTSPTVRWNEAQRSAIGAVCRRIELLDGLAHRRLEAGEGEVAARLAPHRPRQGEALRIAAAWPPARPPARRESPGPEASRSCRSIRRPHRRWSCRAA